MKFTGERMIPELNKGNLIVGEHYVRYIFSSQFVKDKTVLDIACGSGYGTKYLADKGSAKVYGIDNSHEAIEYAQNKYKHSNVEYLVGSAEKIPLKKKAVDVVVSMETIEHVAECKKFLSGVKRVLRDNGICVLSTPNREVYETQRNLQGKNPFHTKEFTTTEFNNLLRSYFNYVELYFQFDWASSLILNKSASAQKDITSTLDVNAVKSTSEKPKGSIYIIGLCSDKKLPKYVDSNVLIFEDEEFKDYRYNLHLLEGKRERLEHQVDKLGEELSSIYDSKTWKLAAFLQKVKHLVYDGGARNKR